MSNRNIFPKDLHKSKIAKDKKEYLNKRKFLNFNRKFNNLDLYKITTKYHLLLKSGLSMLDSFKFISKESNKSNISTTFDDIEKQLKAGAKLSEALLYSKKFPQYFIDYVKVGEENNSLISSFDSLSKYYKNKIDLDSKMKNAWIYPIILILATIGVGIIFMTVVIPNFIDLYSDFHGEIPKSTRLLINTSTFLIDNSLVIILFLLIIIFLYRIALKNVKFKLNIDYLKLNLPVLKDILKVKYAYETADVISMSLSSNLNITDALEKSAEVINNEKVKYDYNSALYKLKTGQSLYESFRDINYLPNNFLEMINIGEESGTLIDSFTILKNFYKVEFENKLKNYLTFIEPTILIILALFIEFMLIALLMPMVTLIDILV